MRWPFIALLTVLFLSEPVRTEPISPYTQADIDRVEERAVPTLHSILLNDIIGRLPRQDREVLAGLTLETPRRLDPWSPFAVWAVPAQKKIVFPMETIRFLDDIATAAAALQLAGCDHEALAIYASILTRQDPPTDRPPNPLQALRIDRDRALADSDIDSMSQGILKTSIAYILAHELGHVVNNHGAAKTAAESRNQERQSDQYALRVFKIIGTVPFGMAVTFFAMAHSQQVPGDFTSKKRFEEYISKRSTHPLDGERLMAIAEIMRTDAALLARNEPNAAEFAKLVAQSATDFQTLGRLVDDIDIRRYQAEKGRTETWDRIATYCPAAAR
jgi:hypothetical protein